MAEYSSFKLTTAGLNLRTRCDVLGESLVFIKFELGDGTWVYPESVPAMVALDNPRKAQPITEVKQRSATEYSVKTVITNDDLPVTGFAMREIGLWAKTAEQDVEVLYGLIYAGESADHLPAAGGDFAYDYLINVVIETGSPDLVVVTVTNVGGVERGEFVIHQEGIVDPTKSGDVGKHVTDSQAAGWQSHVDNDSLHQSFPLGWLGPLPYRHDELPAGFYFANGDNDELASPQGQALNALPENLKNDWGIVVTGDLISRPNMFHEDGRGFFVRGVDGVTRQVGSVDLDGLPNIIGDTSSVYQASVAGSTGAIALTMHGSRPAKAGANGVDAGINSSIEFDASRSNPIYGNSPWVTPLSVAMTYAIYLGV